ncbi:TetR/AcrR family transcriptional regulator [Nocardioides sp. URHA0020]|uniref:TetR/AcrR family transcriptional regulator n=1 Tax=Nocardioides sp. URHA0020 TaxID=1380392 RepID=UPI0006871A98|nr:TetR/AcrR family transcriptional regulator [Nocardioides sp. URHA0020]
MTEQLTEEPTGQPATDGRVRRGDRTRRTVLAAAVDVASIEGLDGLSIGRLATDLAISKSGLIAHFGTKEGLQLATIRAARAIFVHTVIEPALQTPPGLARVRRLLDAWLEYSSDRRFPGGCFFARASHEYAARPGEVRDALAALDEEWLGLIAETIAGAQEVGEVVADLDPTQLAYELDAYLDSANLRSLLGRPGVYEQAKRAVRDRLSSVAPRP